MNHNTKKNIATSIAILMLCAALLDGWDYGFFTILRFVVCTATAYIAWMAFAEQREKWVWIFGSIAILFNPLIPIYLNREIWLVIDVAVAIFLFGTIFLFKLHRDASQ